MESRLVKRKGLREGDRVGAFTDRNRGTRGGQESLWQKEKEGRLPARAPALGGGVRGSQADAPPVGQKPRLTGLRSHSCEG